MSRVFGVFQAKKPQKKKQGKGFPCQLSICLPKKQAAVWASFATGLCITLTQFILNAVLKISFENAVLKYFCGSSINAGMLAMVVGLIMVPVVSAMTQKSKPEGTDEIFACYDRMVTVPAGTALENED